MSVSSRMLTEQLQLVKKSPSHWELILNRPDKYNAITGDMYDGITQVLNEAAQDPDLVLLSVTGRGKFYSSGTDLSDPAKAFTSTGDDIEGAIEQGKIRLKNFIESFINFPKILISFVNGPAVGISVTTLGLFDGVYASSASTFVLPFTRTALSAEGCSSYVFPSLMGALQAKEILLFDRKLTAQEAQQRGLVTQVIQESAFEEEKEKICQLILSLPKGSLLDGKALIQKWYIDKLKEVNEEELNTLKRRWVTDEFMEAIMKFMSTRKRSKL
ncbi:unnamed protein product [Adineta ricciae]|uniref:Uncharacterized protein n=1 Tax=Adineta ricciae TaxID=249248 RepID=A0A813ZYY7_ADIRI|nr:unnamed protein product [Adineta ricciae]